MGYILWPLLPRRIDACHSWNPCQCVWLDYLCRCLLYAEAKEEIYSQNERQYSSDEFERRGAAAIVDNQRKHNGYSHQIQDGESPCYPHHHFSNCLLIRIQRSFFSQFSVIAQCLENLKSVHPVLCFIYYVLPQVNNFCVGIFRLIENENT